jgi:hypothetical protein
MFGRLPCFSSRPHLYILAAPICRERYNICATKKFTRRHYLSHRENIVLYLRLKNYILSERFAKVLSQLCSGCPQLVSEAPAKQGHSSNASSCNQIKGEPVHNSTIYATL